LGELVQKIPLRKDEEDVGNKKLEVDCKKAAGILLEAIEDGHYQVMLQAEKALEKFKKDRAAHIMPNLLTLIPTVFGKTAFNALTSIQVNCEFYNYDIAIPGRIQQFYAALSQANHRLLMPYLTQNRYKQTQTSQQPPLTQNTINVVKEVKIFENIDKYYESPPNDN
jgi:hypothetical protein